jgi:hypothetical protein
MVSFIRRVSAAIQCYDEGCEALHLVAKTVLSFLFIGSGARPSYHNQTSGIRYGERPLKLSEPLSDNCSVSRNRDREIRQPITGRRTAASTVKRNTESTNFAIENTDPAWPPYAAPQVE